MPLYYYTWVYCVLVSTYVSLLLCVVFSICVCSTVYISSEVGVLIFFRYYISLSSTLCLYASLLLYYFVFLDYSWTPERLAGLVSITEV